MASTDIRGRSKHRTQFSVLVSVVILSAVVPTAVAQRFFSPPMHELTAEEVIEVEDEEFEPAHRIAPVRDAEGG